MYLEDHTDLIKKAPSCYWWILNGLWSLWGASTCVCWPTNRKPGRKLRKACLKWVVRADDYQPGWLHRCYQHCWDKDEDTTLKSTEFAVVKGPSRYNYIVSPVDYIKKSCDIQLRDILRGYRGRISAFMMTGRYFINHLLKFMTVFQDCNASLLENLHRDTHTYTIKHQLQPNYSTMTPSRGASSSWDQCVSVTMEILWLLSFQEGDTMTTKMDKIMAVSCNNLNDNHINPLRRCVHMHTNSIQNDRMGVYR